MLKSNRTMNASVKRIGDDGGEEDCMMFWSEMFLDPDGCCRGYITFVAAWDVIFSDVGEINTLEAGPIRDSGVILHARSYPKWGS